MSFFYKLYNYFLYLTFINSAHAFRDQPTYTVSAEDARQGPTMGYGLTVDRFWLHILEPSSLDYFYPVQLAKDFGRAIMPNDPIVGNIVLADPEDACNLLVSKSKFFYQNKIVLAVRGTCSFAQKTVNIEKAGGVVALIYDSDPESQLLISMGDDDDKTAKDVKIPSYAMYHLDGKNIRDEIVEAKRSIESRFHLKMSDMHATSTQPSDQKRHGFEKSTSKSHIQKNLPKELSETEAGEELAPGASESEIKEARREKASRTASKIENNESLRLHNEILIEHELAQQFACRLPMNVTKAHLMQPPWRIWHDEL